MQLGFVTAILPDLSFADVLKFAKETGYDCVEVMCWPVSKAERRYAGVTHIDVTNFDESQAAEVKKVIATSRVEVSALGYYPNQLSPNADEAAKCVEHLKKVIAAAR